MPLPVPETIRDKTETNQLDNKDSVVSADSWISNGELEAKPVRRTTSFKLNEDLFKFIREMAIKRGFKFNRFIEEAIVYYLEDYLKTNNIHVSQTEKDRWIPPKK
jgi:hypothetical protein